MVKLTWRIWLLAIFIVLSLISIFGIPPKFIESGVVVRSIEINSTATDAGLTNGEIIISVNEQPVNSFEDYSLILTSIFEGNNNSQKLVYETNKGKYVFFSEGIPQIIVEDIPATNLKLGLDIQGGSRALVKPDIDLTDKELDDLISVSQERFNVYGLSDISIRPVSDLSGNKFMLIEIAGATPNDLEKLVGEQGKFEAKIGDETVFTGGNEDITYVCRDDAQCSRIERCNQQPDGSFFCSYSFTIHLSEAAAKKHADITKELSINSSNPGYLEKTIDFYVDDKLTTSLLISEGLRGFETTQVSISGSGFGVDQESAYNDAELSMKQMQTILITGSLPYKLEIVKLDTISPALGNEFDRLILILGFSSLLVVALIIFIRYRNIKACGSLLLTSFSEILIILGIASLINWNLDLPSIVGILVTIGTGVDQQIVILDESKSKRSESLRQKIKAALFIVVSAYLTTAVSLLPLWWAGAGLLKGFMVTTLIGLTIGVLITRPAFADLLKIIDKKDAS